MAHLVIVGPMAAGKTTLGRALAEALDRRHVDSDDDIVERTGRTGREVAADEGVAALHALEAEVLLDRLGERDEDLIVGAAASTIESEACRDALGACLVIWLDLDAETSVARAVAKDHRRAVSRDDAVALDARRRPLLEAAANLRIDATRPADEILAEVLAFVPGADGA